MDISGEQQFELQCHYFDYNGRTFGEVTTFLYIPRFYEVKKIASLNIFPLQYHESKTEVMRNLIERGRRFTTLMESHHCNYKGLAYIQQAAGPFQFTVDGSCMDCSRSACQHGHSARRSQAETALVMMRHCICCLRSWCAGPLANVLMRELRALGSCFGRRA